MPKCDLINIEILMPDLVTSCPELVGTCSVNWTQDHVEELEVSFLLVCSLDGEGLSQLSLK